MRNRRLVSWTLYVTSVLAVGVIGTALSMDKQPDFTGQPPYTVEELWTKVLRALDTHNGSMTKERFETIFDMKFAHLRTESDAKNYLAHEKVDWYFNGRVTIYNDNFKFPLVPEINGAHSEWYIAWEPGSFADACLTAEKVRETLLANGWTSPWKSWGLWEEMAREAWAHLGDGLPPPDPTKLQDSAPHPPRMAPPIASFSRSNAQGGHPNALPRGHVVTDGDQPSSCVTGIFVEAKP
jgi:hypothetical protein